MIWIANYGTPLTTAQATALNSFVALATTPVGYHLAKNSSGEFENTADTGAGGGITTLNALTATTQTFADVDDTNVTLAISSVTSTHTFTLGWTGTLAAARLNANVVQAVSNDTNVTGSISTQTLTLGWTGTLAVSRGGLGANLSALTTNNLAKFNGTNFVDSLLASTVSGARLISAGTLTADRTITNPDLSGTNALSGASQTVSFGATTVSSLLASSNDSGALGASGTAFADLFLASGAVINFNAGDVTLTHSSNLLTFAGGQFAFGANTAYFTLTDNGNSGTADTIDWTLSNKQKSTLTGNVTFTFTAPGGPTSLILECIQDGTVRTVTWPTSVKWSGGTAPTMTGTSGKSDIITFFYNGTVYYGNSTLNFTNS